MYNNVIVGTVYFSCKRCKVGKGCKCKSNWTVHTRSIHCGLWRCWCSDYNQHGRYASWEASSCWLVRFLFVKPPKVIQCQPTWNLTVSHRPRDEMNIETWAASDRQTNMLRRHIISISFCPLEVVAWMVPTTYSIMCLILFTLCTRSSRPQTHPNKTSTVPQTHPNKTSTVGPIPAYPCSAPDWEGWRRPLPTIFTARARTASDRHAARTIVQPWNALTSMHRSDTEMRYNLKSTKCNLTEV